MKKRTKKRVAKAVETEQGPTGKHYAMDARRLVAYALECQRLLTELREEASNLAGALEVTEVVS